MAHPKKCICIQCFAEIGRKAARARRTDQIARKRESADGGK